MKAKKAIVCRALRSQKEYFLGTLNPLLLLPMADMTELFLDFPSPILEHPTPTAAGGFGDALTAALDVMTFAVDASAHTESAHGLSNVTQEMPIQVSTDIRTVKAPGEVEVKAVLATPTTTTTGEFNSTFFLLKELCFYLRRFSVIVNFENS
jgi:hypothetical protein